MQQLDPALPDRGFQQVHLQVYTFNQTQQSLNTVVTCT